MLKLFLLLNLIFPEANAEILFDDPQGLLPEFAKEFTGQIWQNLMPINTKAKFMRYVDSCELSCNDATPENPLSGCSVMCKIRPTLTYRSIIALEDNKYAIYGDDGYYQEWSESVWLNEGKNFAKASLRSIEQLLQISGIIRLDKITRFAFPLEIKNGESRKVNAVSLWGRFTPDGYHANTEVKITLIPGAHGAAQIALLSISGEVYFKLLDY